MKIIIYVVCHNARSEAVARSLAAKYRYLKVHRIPDPQSHLFEAKMFVTELPRLLSEWSAADYVGLLSYSFEQKQPNTLERKLRAIEAGRYDFIPFCAGAHLDNIEKLHNTSVASVFYQTAAAAGLQVQGPMCYFNSWACRASFMKAYIQWFTIKWLPKLEAHPLVWKDASYKNGRMSREALLQVSRGRSDKFTCHSFVNERIVHAYFRSVKATMPAIILKAFYGVKGMDMDVYRRLVLISGQPFKVDNATMGRDPAPGKVKALHVEFVHENGVLQKLDIQEGTTAALPWFADYRGPHI